MNLIPSNETVALERAEGAATPNETLNRVDTDTNTTKAHKLTL